MWLIKFLPDWLFYGLIVLGLVGLFATYFLRLIPIPAFYIYKTPIQIASIISIVLGTFMVGAVFNEHAWLERVRELEVKVAEAEAKSAKETIKIVEKVVTKTQVIREKGDETIKFIDKEIVKYDSNCVIPSEFVNAHNKLAEQPK